ncbi:MAG: type IV pilus biogenesis protein PilP [Alphaproteobacteria bacterium]|nr:type IV pilus biogenesis protein PilP [Alphaproteobacteria bacterium]
MRTANKFSIPRRSLKGLGAAFLLVIGSCLSSPAFSQEAPAAPSLVSSAMAAPAPSDPAKPVLPAAKTESIEKSVLKAEDKVIETAKGQMKKLDSASSETSLAELNQVRQTISRIEAMIDVQKRLNELEKLRGVSRSASVANVPAGLADAIPASALSLPRRMRASSGDSASKSTAARSAHVSAARPEVERIIGSGGRYTAYLRLAGNERRAVRVGDKVSDGETVRSITSSSVEVGGKNSSYTLRMKNIDIIQGVMR